jgi:hypothetical protein
MEDNGPSLAEKRDTGFTKASHTIAIHQPQVTHLDTVEIPSNPGFYDYLIKYSLIKRTVTIRSPQI